MSALACPPAPSVPPGANATTRTPCSWAWQMSSGSISAGCSAVGTTVVRTLQSKCSQFPEPKPKISRRECSGVVIGWHSSGRLHGHALAEAAAGAVAATLVDCPGIPVTMCTATSSSPSARTRAPIAGRGGRQRQLFTAHFSPAAAAARRFVRRSSISRGGRRRPRCRSTTVARRLLGRALWRSCLTPTMMATDLLLRAGLLLLGGCACSVAAAPTRVLFIGNSFTFVNDLPHQLVNIARSLGKEVEVANSTIGGCTTYYQRAETDARTAELLEQEWDYIVLQSYSNLPTVQQSRETYLTPAVHSFVAKKKKAKVVMYLTWGYHSGNEPGSCPSSGPVKCFPHGTNAALTSPPCNTSGVYQAKVNTFPCMVRRPDGITSQLARHGPASASWTTSICSALGFTHAA
jgi:hypothetical protein